MTIFLLVFIASFLGSLHCGIMCCHLQLLSGSLQSRNFWQYHLSRGLGYLCLALALRLGRHSVTYLTGVIDSENILTLILVAILLTLGLYMLTTGRKPHLPLSVKKAIPTQSKTLGFLTALMPCGWLWIFLTLGLSQKTLSANLILISVFWLGTLTPFLVLKFLSQGPWKNQDLMSLLRGALLNRILGVLIILTAGLQYAVKTGKLASPDLLHSLNSSALWLVQTKVAENDSDLGSLTLPFAQKFLCAPTAPVPLKDPPPGPQAIAPAAH